MKSPSEFSLIQVSTYNTLPYTILLHTWTNQEIVYQDLISSTRKSKSGYNKIKFYREQVIKDSLQYFQVDTYCINKPDSTELMTAINSIFYQYRNAERYYVYLTDISTSCNDIDVQEKQSIQEVAFLDSKQFTRGQILQELIALMKVDFFSKEGK